MQVRGHTPLRFNGSRACYRRHFIPYQCKPKVRLSLVLVGSHRESPGSLRVWEERQWRALYSLLGGNRRLGLGCGVLVFFELRAKTAYVTQCFRFDRSTTVHARNLRGRRRFVLPSPHLSMESADGECKVPVFGSFSSRSPVALLAFEVLWKIFGPRVRLGLFLVSCMYLSCNDASFKCLPYQLSMVGSAPTMVVTGNGESGFDSGEGA